MKHIVSFSGGKDSTAMLLMMLEKKIHIDDIIFANVRATDTIGGEYPPMYDYIANVEDHIKRKITFLTPNRTFEEQFYTRYMSGKYIGTIYGYPMIKGSWCNSRLKMTPINKYLAQQGNYKCSVGIAVDEPKRLAKLKKKKNSIAPLAEWNITEQQCRDYLKEKDMLNPLYNKFHRLGCWFCPKADLMSLRILRNDYPQLWNKLLQWDKDSIVTFKPTCTACELDNVFNEKMSIYDN